MIILNHNTDVVQHSGFPAICRHLDTYSAIIKCTDFTPDLDWKIIDQVGRILSDYEKSWWGEMREGELLTSILPEGYQIRIKPAQRLVTDDEKVERLTEILREHSKLFSEEEEESSIKLDLENIKVKEYKPEGETAADEIVYTEMTYLEAFNVLIERSRDWWFGSFFGLEEIKIMKSIAGVDQHGIIGTLEMVKMFIANTDFDGIIERANNDN